MSDVHIHRELLQALFNRRRPPADLVPRILAHLTARCPRCREELEAFNQEAAGVLPDLSALEGEPVAALQDHPTGEGGADSGAVDALLTLPADRRATAVAKERRRFADPALVPPVLEAARAKLPGHPRDAWALAELARTMLQHARKGAATVPLYARAVAWAGNALRAQGELAHAGEHLAHARFLLRSHDEGDPLLRAELDHLEGSLRRAQRRLPEAAELLHRAVGTYLMSDRAVEAARVSLTLATVRREQGDLPAAIQATRHALGLLQAEDEPRLILYACHNLAALYLEARQYAEAREMVDSTLELYQRFPDPLTQLRLVWLEAHLARAEGDLEGAESGYRAARDGFRRQEMPYDVALVSLDLAALYLEQGRTVEVKELAEEVLPLFEVREIYREAAAALLLFADAARREHLSLATVRELARYLEAARSNPGLTFEPAP